MNLSPIQQAAVATQADFHRTQSWRQPCHAVSPEQLRSLFVAKERLDKIVEWCKKNDAPGCECCQCKSLRRMVDFATTGNVELL